MRANGAGMCMSAVLVSGIHWIVQDSARAIALPALQTHACLTYEFPSMQLLQPMYLHGIDCVRLCVCVCVCVSELYVTASLRCLGMCVL